MTRKVKGLRVARGERYALMPEEVMESDAYRAQPDWARTVLFALAAQYYGKNNGDFSLPPAEALRLGVSANWKLYAGLKLLEQADLILCTRRGRLERGTKVCSLFAFTWRGIDEAKSATYDGDIRPNPVPSHAWAKWTRPANWTAIVKEIARANHGKNPDPETRKKENPVSTTMGKGRSTTMGKGKALSDQRPWVKEQAKTVPMVVDTSKTLAGGTAKAGHGSASGPLSALQIHSRKNGGARKIEKLATIQSHLTNADIAKITGEPIELVQVVREAMR